MSNEERALCSRRAYAIAEPGTDLACRIADAIQRERQAVREPLEAMVRELERDLAAADKCLGVVMRASPHETFDPQAVRDLLQALDSMSQPRDQHVLHAIRRVRESETKRREGGE